MTRPALFLALLYLAHRVNRLVTEVEAWRYETKARERPTGAMIGLDPNRTADGRIHVGDRDARHVRVEWHGLPLNEWDDVPARDPGDGAR